MFLKHFFVSAVLSVLLLATTVIAEENSTANTQAMQKSMDPEVWSNMMSMMMDPSKMSSPMENCAQCHDGEDLARYQEQFGPMMDAMFNMYKSMSPQQMMAMMGPMMGMMNPMMSMMGPMMNPMMMGGMMGPMMGMMNPMGMMGGMNPMQHGGTGAANPMNMMGSMNGMMDPKQYEQWFNQMTEMMPKFAPNAEQ